MVKVVITGGRGSGKTLKLLRMADENCGCVVCNTEQEAKHVVDLIKLYKLKNVAVSTYEQTGFKRIYSSKLGQDINKMPLYINDFDRWSDKLLPWESHLNVAGYSTGEETYNLHMTARSRKKIYFASPLFTEMELAWNEKTVNTIEEYFDIQKRELDIYLPQRNMSINDKNAYADSLMIADGDNTHLLESGLLIAVLDGQVIDAGVASEIGIAFANNIPIIGVYTDSRTQGHGNIKKIDALSTLGECQFHYANLYTIGLIKKNGVLVRNTQELVRAVDKFQKGEDFK